MFGKHIVWRLALAIVVVLMAAACGGEGSSDTDTQDTQSSAATTVQGDGASGETTAAMAEATVEENAYNPDAEIGPNEESNMMPADGQEPDPSQPLPENPPEGVKTYPADGNALIEGDIQYDRDPPTNGDHSPLWQNCGFYSEPIDEKTAVHSMDHGVVWITYRPDLPQQQIDQLQPYGDERYVIVSPYPGLPAPVVATSWRNQIYLEGPSDPRLREFVDEFRISEIAPLSGNRCVGGVGEPEA